MIVLASSSLAAMILIPVGLAREPPGAGIQFQVLGVAAAPCVRAGPPMPASLPKVAATREDDQTAPCPEALRAR